ncbi:MAG: hypothetical protein ACFB6S_01810 [Geminicoccaceae bacterium]
MKLLRYLWILSVGLGLGLASVFVMLRANIVPDDWALLPERAWRHYQAAETPAENFVYVIGILVACLATGLAIAVIKARRDTSRF